MVEWVLFSEIRSGCVALEGALRELDPERLDGLAAVRVLRELARVEHVVAEAKGRVARRVDESKVWQRQGTKSAAHLVATLTGTSVGVAAGVLETAERLESLPVTAEAYAKGRLSSVQAATIANAAIEVPDAEHELVDCAIDGPFASLRDHAPRVKARGTDLLERDRRIHAARQVREWTDGEGAWNLSARGTGTDGARIMAALKSEADTVFKQARIDGQREPADAYAFDALLRLTTRDATTTTTSGPRSHVHVNVDAAALLATKGLPGATCQIPRAASSPTNAARSRRPYAAPSKRAIPNASSTGARAATTWRTTIWSAGPTPTRPPSKAVYACASSTTTSSPTTATPSNHSATAPGSSSPPTASAARPEPARPHFPTSTLTTPERPATRASVTGRLAAVRRITALGGTVGLAIVAAMVSVTGTALASGAKPEVTTIPFPGGGTTDAVAVDRDGVWVVDEVNETVVRLDPATGDVVATIDVAGPSDVAVGLGAVWVASDAGVVRIDPATNKVTATVATPQLFRSDDVVVGAGAVWTAGDADNVVLRIDPATLAATATIDIGSSPYAMAVGERGLWVTTIEGEALSRVDTTTNEVTPVGNKKIDGGPVAAGAGGVWTEGTASALGGTTLCRLRPPSGAVTCKPVQAKVTDLTVGLGSVWISAEDGVVLRVDPRSLRPTATIRTNGRSLSDIATGKRDVWVVDPVSKDSSVIRISP
jgi:Domain of unknown function (DUF222)